MLLSAEQKEGLRAIRRVLASATNGEAVVQLVDMMQKTKCNADLMARLKELYIRRRSEHSYGVAVDVTLICLATGQELDMGGRHDFLDATSATRYTGLTPEQHANRMLLRDTMDRAGMRNYKREWWHYFLKIKGSVTRYDFPLCDTLIDKP